MISALDPTEQDTALLSTEGDNAGLYFPPCVLNAADTIKNSNDKKDDDYLLSAVMFGFCRLLIQVLKGEGNVAALVPALKLFEVLAIRGTIAKREFLSPYLEIIRVCPIGDCIAAAEYLISRDAITRYILLDSANHRGCRFALLLVSNSMIKILKGHPKAQLTTGKLRRSLLALLPPDESKVPIKMTTAVERPLRPLTDDPKSVWKDSLLESASSVLSGAMPDDDEAQEAEQGEVTISQMQNKSFVAQDGPKHEADMLKRLSETIWGTLEFIQTPVSHFKIVKIDEFIQHMRTLTDLIVYFQQYPLLCEQGISQVPKTADDIAIIPAEPVLQAFPPQDTDEGVVEPSDASMTVAAIRERWAGQRPPFVAFLVALEDETMRRDIVLRCRSFIVSLRETSPAQFGVVLTAEQTKQNNVFMTLHADARNAAWRLWEELEKLLAHWTPLPHTIASNTLLDTEVALPPLNAATFMAEIDMAETRDGGTSSSITVIEPTGPKLVETAVEGSMLAAWGQTVSPKFTAFKERARSFRTSILPALGKTTKEELALIDLLIPTEGEGEPVNTAKKEVCPPPSFERMKTAWYIDDDDPQPPDASVNKKLKSLLQVYCRKIALDDDPANEIEPDEKAEKNDLFQWRADRLLLSASGLGIYRNEELSSVVSICIFFDLSQISSGSAAALLRYEFNETRQP